MKLIKNNLQLWGIQPPAAHLDYPSALLSNKGVLLLEQRAIFQINLIQFFILNKQFLNLSHFFSEIILSYILCILL